MNVVIFILLIFYVVLSLIVKYALKRINVRNMFLKHLIKYPNIN